MVSIPGAPEDAALRDLAAAAEALVPFTRAVELPERYTS